MAQPGSSESESTGPGSTGSGSPGSESRASDSGQAGPPDLLLGQQVLDVSSLAKNWWIGYPVILVSCLSLARSDPRLAPFVLVAGVLIMIVVAVLSERRHQRVFVYERGLIVQIGERRRRVWWGEILEVTPQPPLPREPLRLLTEDGYLDLSRGLEVNRPGLFSSIITAVDGPGDPSGSGPAPTSGVDTVTTKTARPGGVRWVMPTAVVLLTLVVVLGGLRAIESSQKNAATAAARAAAVPAPTASAEPYVPPVVAPGPVSAPVPLAPDPVIEPVPATATLSPDDPARDVAVTELQVGMCIETFADAETVTSMRVVGCAQPHRGQLIKHLSYYEGIALSDSYCESPIVLESAEPKPYEVVRMDHVDTDLYGQTRAWCVAVFPEATTETAT